MAWFDYEPGQWRSGSIEVPYLVDAKSRQINPLPMLLKIPDVMGLIERNTHLKVKDVYLLEYLEEWPLFKVVALHFTQFTRTLQLYLVGRDKHTDEPFVLGIPNGFEKQPIEACLRWTLNAHKGDEVHEV